MSTPAVDTTVANPDVLTKYKAAGDIAQNVLAELKALAVPGAIVSTLTAKGDERLAEETAKVFNNKKGLSKGIAFPTSISIDACVAHYAPAVANEEVKLEKGQVAKIEVGAQIDGYASLVSDTIVIGGDSEATEQVSNAIAAAWYASEAALRTIKPGVKNWAVTRVVDEVTREFGVKAIEGMMSQEHTQNSVAGKKKLILNPTEQQRKDFEAIQFGENEVYGLDILISPGAGKVREADELATIYRKTDLTYSLKLRASRLAITEIQKKAGTFPFNVNILEDQKRVRMALQEPVNHGLLEKYDVVYDKEGLPVVQFFTTFALTKTGITKLAAPAVPDLAALKAPKQAVTSEELSQLLATSLKVNKKKKSKAATASA